MWDCNPSYGVLVKQQFGAYHLARTDAKGTYWWMFLQLQHRDARFFMKDGGFRV